ncbi:MAG: Glycosyltransferase like family 2 [Rhodobacteraceae bacterium HLUCCA24]|nr:MAG: Glycosyltransferase like family 2 [Rhodobacteraceae bacterium HLUCCA24]
MTPQRPSPAVAVLLATYNGAPTLAEQLDSYLAQTRLPDLVLISDDGSTDGTRDAVEAFRVAHPEIRIEVVDGPRRGPAQNFFSLLQRTPAWIDVVALSDQDDVWLPDKLERGLRALTEAAMPGVPTLYCARTLECDETLQRRRLSRGMSRPPGFRHALVQNIAGGNTMMLDRAGLDLVREGSVEARRVVVHDWWIYQIVTGAGGRVVFDQKPVLLYRQHSGNLIGANTGLAAKARRLRLMLSGRFRRWNTINIRALSASAHRLTPENRQLLLEFEACRQGPVWKRLRTMRQTRLYRQGFQGLLSLYAAALLGRL